MTCIVTPDTGQHLPQHAIVRQILVLSAICRALPRNAHVVMDNLPQSIMASLVYTAGMSSDVVVTEPLLQRYGFDLIDMFDAAGLPLICLGADTADLLLTPPVEAGYPGLARHPHRITIQTVDELCSGLHRVSWLAFESVDLAFLNQSLHCITSQRPLISLTFAGSVTSLLQWCVRYNYRAVDAELTEVSSEFRMPNKVYLFPSGPLIEDVTTLLYPAEGSEPDVVINNSQLVHGWPALCFAGDELARLTKRYLTSSARQYPLASMLATQLYPAELNDGITWRWTGPGHNTTILVPLRVRGMYRISLSVLALPEGLETNWVRCFINGVNVMSGAVKADSEIAFDYMADKPELPAELVISVTDMVDRGGRHLGIAISGIQATWQVDQ